MKTIQLFLSLAILCIAFQAKAQTEPQDTSKQIYQVVKTDGFEYIGEILSDDGREILMYTDALGKIYIPKSEIQQIEEIENPNRIVHGEYRDTGPFTTRYAFTNNAHPVVKGENYAVINLYGPEVHFALADNFSLGIMSTWIASPLALAAKYSIPTKNPKLNFSVGTLMGTSGYLNTFRGYLGLHWANITYGDRMNNISFSAGYGYLDPGIDSFMAKPGIYYNTYPDENLSYPLLSGPMASIGGIVKVGTNVSFVFDSMFMYASITGTSTEYNETQAGYYDEVAQTWIEPQFTYTVTRERQGGFAMMFMPGIRYQVVENRAFQFNLAGIALVSEGDAISFPFPMCTWYFKL